MIDLEDFRAQAPDPFFGLVAIEGSEPLISEANKFIEWLATQLPKIGNPHRYTVGLETIDETPAEWMKCSYTVYPLYIERLNILQAGAQTAPGLQQPRPGAWTVEAQFLTKDSDLFWKHHKIEWISWFRETVMAREGVGGISYNVINVPAEALTDGELDVRPLTLHAMDQSGRAADRTSIASQTAIANAFWQTFWATGALRAERGQVFPVAFLPVDRTNQFENSPPFHERYISLRRRLFGRTSILAYVCEKLTQAKALYFDVNQLKFCVARDYQPVGESPACADVLLCIAELNRTAFIDAFTGSNAETFAAWKTALDAGTISNEPAPYSDPNWSAKIPSQSKDCGDYLTTVRAPENGNLVEIRRVVPFSGCAYLSEVINETDRLRAIGKIQDFDDTILAATNSTFFLNFPEEYSSLHTAMNDPVSALVEDGKTLQVKTVRRAAFTVSKTGEASITTRLANHLTNDALVFEGESSAITAFDSAHKSYAENRYGPLFFGAVLNGNQIVETFEECDTEVPASGWIIGDSEAFGGRITPEKAAQVVMRKETSGEEIELRHALAVGPLLLQNGITIELGQSGEEFCGLKATATSDFDEGSALTRTQLPQAMLHCESRGVPPTRFPYDWNLTRAPRTAIGTKADGSVVLVVVDGRADLKHSVGASLAQMASIMKSLGCTDAMNMDGGGSSIMFLADPESEFYQTREGVAPGMVSYPSDLGGSERLLPVPLVVCKK